MRTNEEIASTSACILEGKIKDLYAGFLFSSARYQCNSKVGFRRALSFPAPLATTWL